MVCSMGSMARSEPSSRLSRAFAWESVHEVKMYINTGYVQDSQKHSSTGVAMFVFIILPRAQCSGPHCCIFLMLSSKYYNFFSFYQVLYVHSVALTGYNSQLLND